MGSFQNSLLALYTSAGKEWEGKQPRGWDSLRQSEAASTKRLDGLHNVRWDPQQARHLRLPSSMTARYSEQLVRRACLSSLPNGSEKKDLS